MYQTEQLGWLPTASRGNKNDQSSVAVSSPVPPSRSIFYPNQPALSQTTETFSSSGSTYRKRGDNGWGLGNVEKEGEP